MHDTTWTHRATGIRAGVFEMTVFALRHSRAANGVSRATRAHSGRHVASRCRVPGVRRHQWRSQADVDRFRCARRAGGVGHIRDEGRRDGWAIGGREEGGDSRDYGDAEALHDLLENEVLPAWFTRNTDGLPVRWLSVMKNAIASSLYAFSTRRMPRDYRALVAEVC